MASFSEEDVKERFDRAAIFVQSMAHTFDTDHLLKLYALYKQSTVGMCRTGKPAWYEVEAKRKWTAWNSLGNMDRAEAMRGYCETLSELRPEWEESEAQEKTRWVSVSCMLPEEEEELNRDKTILDYVKEGDLEMVSRRLEGCELDGLDESGLGLLHWAADRGNTALVRLLLDSQASIDLRDSTGQTALHYACSCGHADVAQLLMERGASPVATCSEGLTPSDIALTPHIRSLLSQPHNT